MESDFICKQEEIMIDDVSSYDDMYNTVAVEHQQNIRKQQRPAKNKDLDYLYRSEEREAVENLLKRWNFAAMIPKFREEQIDLYTLKFLIDRDVTEKLFKGYPMSVWLKFYNKLSTWKNDNNLRIFNADKSPSCSTSTSHNEIYFPVSDFSEKPTRSKTKRNRKISKPALTNIKTLENDNESLLYNFNNNYEDAGGEVPEEPDNEVEDDPDFEPPHNQNSLKNISSKNTDDNVLVARILVNAQIRNKADLEFILKSEAPEIMSEIRQRGGKLDNRIRIDIAKVIMRSLMKQNPNRSFSRAEFLELSGIIKQLFPNENPLTYFNNANGKWTGKLYNKYTGLRSLFKSVGLIPKTSEKSKSTKTRSTIEHADDESADPFKDTDGDDSQNEASDLGEELIEDFKEEDSALIEWESEFSEREKFRSSLLRYDKMRLFFQKYPVLQNEQQAVELITSDVLTKFPKIKRIKNWFKYYPTVLFMAKEKASKSSSNPVLNTLLRQIQKETDEAKIAVLCLVLLPFILPPKRKHVSSYGFSSIVDCFSSVQEFKESQNDYISECDKSRLILSPKIALIEEGTPVVMVAVADFYYTFPKLLDGVEFAMFIYLELEIDFPEALRVAFNLFTLLVFDIEKDPVSSSVITVLSDIKNTAKNQLTS